MIIIVQLQINPIEMYDRYGFSELKLYSGKEMRALEIFATNWLYRLLAKWVGANKNEFQLQEYHTWWEMLDVDHGNLFRERNRYADPGLEIKDIIINEKMRQFLTAIGVKYFDLWDEGIGWLGFRFIRPGCGDGYPMSRKEWGPAKNVVSLWVPIIGHSNRETLALVPGSHLREYKKYLPTASKFRKDEYRLLDPVDDLEVYRPVLNRGDAVIFHPRILHTEDVKESNVTRLNLEVRIHPINQS